MKTLLAILILLATPLAARDLTLAWDDTDNVAADVDPGGTYIDGGNPGVSCHAPFGFDAAMGLNAWQSFEL